jgi:hypothetical protein
MVQVLAFELTAEVQREKLLRQIEESLAHSHELIAQIEDVRRNRSAWLAQAAASTSP